MKVIEVTRFGGPDVLRAREVHDPVARPGQVVVGVAAADVLSVEAQLRAGWGREWFGAEPPFVPGTGVAGHVLSVGEGVDPSWRGRRVAAMVGGGYAEQALAEVEALVPVPDALPLRDAAALLQVGPAALSLIDAAELKPGARVLVTGAGGGLGLMLVELAAAAGAEVTAMASSTAKRRRAELVGAAHTEQAPRTEQAGQGRFDVVFDGVGGEQGARAFELTAPGGRFFAYGVMAGGPASFDAAEADRRGITVRGMEQVQFTPEEFTLLAERTFNAGITPTIGLAVPLDRAADAHAAIEGRALVGKAVLLATSRAVRYREYGEADVLTVDEVTIPAPGPGQVRIAVKAAAVNALDWKFRKGYMVVPLEGPAGTGIEVSGTIDALGEDVAGWRVGQPVFGRVPTGGLADHVLADPAELLAKPDHLTYEEAAALPVAAETAARTLAELGVEPGRLLIHAVAGGVGLVAAQLARARGVEVVGTAGESHHAFLRDLGVTPVTYGEGWADRVGPVDAVLDASGRGVLADSVRLTGDADKVVTIADPAAGEFGVRFSTGGTDPAPVRDVVESGSVRMPIARVFPLESAADAHRLSEEGHLLGKIVVITEAVVPR
ncbi:zinc-binding dehydrogenase [Nonomuraea sp. NPDC049152]|uniref:zinc-binding dehydrogenase n=1 Tax=Nonomuraea sp. NPDC049152 TaxID=3154350 RepID=UPI0033D9331E